MSRNDQDLRTDQDLRNLLLGLYTQPSEQLLETEKLRAENEKLRKELAAEKQKTQTVELDNTRLQELATRLQGSVNTLQTNLRKAPQRIQRGIEDGSRELVDSLNKTVSEQQKQITNLQAELEAEKTKLAAETEIKEEIKKKSSTNGREKKANYKKNVALQQSVAQLTENTEKQRVEIETLTNENNKTKSAHAKTIYDLHESKLLCHDTAANIQKLVNINIQLMDQVETQKKEIVRLNNVISKLDELIETYKGDITILRNTNVVEKQYPGRLVFTLTRLQNPTPVRPTQSTNNNGEETKTQPAGAVLNP